MDDADMAEAIAFELNDDQWKTEIDCPGVFILTNENGERFVVTVEKEVSDYD